MEKTQRGTGRRDRYTVKVYRGGLTTLGHAEVYRTEGPLHGGGVQRRADNIGTRRGVQDGGTVTRWRCTEEG